MGKISLADIKNEIARSGANKGKILYFKDGTKMRIRFLIDFEEGLKIPFHDSFKLSVNYPCQELFGHECPGCSDEELRTRNKYCWAVYDYESKEVKLLLEAINQCSPVGALSTYYEEYGTLLDRDYTIKQVGSGTNKTFAIMAQEKKAFRIAKVKKLSDSEILKIIEKAFPCEDVVEDEDKEEEADWTKDMKPSQLYKVCRDRGLDVQPRQPKAYYVEKLEQDDEEKDFEAQTDEDEWGGEEEQALDYTKMKAPELYKLCREKEIECEVREPRDYYIGLLEQSKEEEDWPDEDEWGEDSFMNIPDGVDEELPFN